MIILEAIVGIYTNCFNGAEDRRVSYVELLSEVEKLCKDRSLFDVMRMGPGISHFMDDLAFYNIIEVEKPRAEAKKDVKQSRFWLKVELTELERELRLIINPPVPEVEAKVEP